MCDLELIQNPVTYRDTSGSDTVSIHILSRIDILIYQYYDCIATYLYIQYL